MLRPVRTLLSLALLGGFIWFAFAVELGQRTLAEHIDRIGQTPEANDLVEGTRSTVNPVLREATDRVLGEHVEAPTRGSAEAEAEAGPPSSPRPEGSTPARTSSADRPKLPGHGP